MWFEFGSEKSQLCRYICGLYLFKQGLKFVNLGQEVCDTLIPLFPKVGAETAFMCFPYGEEQCVSYGDGGQI